EQLLASTSGALRLVRAVDEQTLDRETSRLAVAKGVSSKEIPVRDLFERFLPEEQRVKRLGSVIRAETILKLKGDEARGKQVFFETAGVQCKNCHRIGTAGLAVAPDLSE